MSIEERRQKLQATLSEVTESCGRQAQEVVLLPVTKRQPLEKLQTLYDLGERHFGENQVQEMNDKAAVLADDIHWHLIGTLQSNKVKVALENAEYIHSVDSLKLLKRIDRLAGELAKQPKLFLQVNVSGEESKHGFTQEELKNALAESLSLKNVTVIGLMTMAVKSADEEGNFSVFDELRELRDSYRAEYPQLTELSMGMSADFPEAVRAGSTWVRVGSALLGERTYS